MLDIDDEVLVLALRPHYVFAIYRGSLFADILSILYVHTLFVYHCSDQGELNQIFSYRRFCFLELERSKHLNNYTVRKTTSPLPALPP